MANEPPDWQYSAFYYAEILAALIAFKAQAWPEHTETNPHDPVVQLLRMFALVGHQGSVRLDHVARELFLPTARLRPSFVAMGAYIGDPLEPPSPASVDMVGLLGSALTTDTVVAKARSIFASNGDGVTPAAVFDYDTDDDLVIGETGTWFVSERRGDPSVVTEIEASYPRQLFGDDPAIVGAGVIRAELYFGHAGAMFTKIHPVVSVLGSPSRFTTSVWEYYDDSRILAPDLVENVAGAPKLRIDTLIWGDATPADAHYDDNGDDDDKLTVIVTCLTTGRSETCRAQWDGAAHMFVTASDALGQGSVSTSAADYTVQTYWPALPGLTDGTVTTYALEKSGDVTWDLPQGADRRWAQTTIGEREGYWIRWRPVNGGSGTRHTQTITAPTQPSGTVWAVLLACRQGRQIEEKVGTSDGTASQAFTLARSDLVELVGLLVGTDAWARVANLLSATVVDRVFALDEQPDGTWKITFGDGTNGRIPPAVRPIVVTYRVDADGAGNVGAGAITRDRSGNGKLRQVYNPRDASGWVEREGSTAASRDRLRASLPAGLRANGRAVAASDYETLAVAYRNADGVQLVTRALAVEEGSGPKTVKLYCVGPDGAPLGSDACDELVTYFDGELVGLQRVGGVSQANTTTDVVGYVPVAVDATITVDVLAAYADGADDLVTTVVSAVLQADAAALIRSSNGTLQPSATEYQWAWGGKVARAVLFARIATSVSGVVNITIPAPAVDLTLAEGEMPVAGTVTVTIVEV